MAPSFVGIDLGQTPLAVGGLVLSKYIVARGTKGIKVNGYQAPSRPEVVEVFHDANQVVKSYFGAPKFQAAVVVVPNSTSRNNREAVAGAATSADFNIVQVINEHTAVAAAYAEKVQASSSRRLAVVSITGDILDVSIISIKSDLEFDLEAQETHLAPNEFEEPKAEESKHSGPGGLIGLVGGVVGGAVKTMVGDPLDKVSDVIKNLLSSSKLSESPVDVVIFVGKASKSEKLKQAVNDRFPSARVWSPEEISAEELPAYGAGVVAFKQKSVRMNFMISEASRPVNYEDFNPENTKQSTAHHVIHLEYDDVEFNDQDETKFSTSSVSL